MENTTKCIIQIIFFFILLSCKTTLDSNKENLTDSKQICKNDESLYLVVKKELLYKDSVDVIYVRIKNSYPEDYPLSRCQKLPFSFLNTMKLKNDSIVKIGDVIDKISFSKFEGSNIYFYDKNKVYALNSAIATWPPFYEVQLDRNSTTIIDSITIKDKINTYRNGMKIE